MNANGERSIAVTVCLAYSPHQRLHGTDKSTPLHTIKGIRLTHGGPRAGGPIKCLSLEFVLRRKDKTGKPDLFCVACYVPIHGVFTGQEDHSAFNNLQPPRINVTALFEITFH